jgi:transcriptional regulator with XRE-family HTH domain
MTAEVIELDGRKPNPVDVHVGSRVRYRRMIVGMSQEKLGEKMNLTFQQIQKYEKGTNRIGASRLFSLSRILEVPVGYFFEDAFADPRLSAGAPVIDGVIDPISLLGDQQIIKLVQGFSKIKSQKLRSRIVALVEELTDDEDEPGDGGPAV